MENNVLRTIMQNNPDMDLFRISRLYGIDKNKLVNTQIRSIQSCKFSKNARSRDYNQAIKDKLSK